MQVAIAKLDYDLDLERDDVFHRIRKDRKRTLCGREIYETGDETKYPGYRVCKLCKRAKT